MPTTDDEQVPPLPLLTGPDWERLGVHDVVELTGGHQSRVVRAVAGTDPVVVKLTDARLVDAREHAARVQVVADLASIDDHVVRPRPLGSTLVEVVGGWLAVTYPFAPGRPADPMSRVDVEKMAVVLASLHDSMRQLAPVGLPLVAALATGDPAALADPSRDQLLHGDYSPSNVRMDGDVVRVIDLDDCGLGPIEHEIGNSLYMVLFDATISGDLPMYRRFRTWFTEAYAAEARMTFDDRVLDSAIERRRGALRHWLDHPDEAPIGIRTSSPAWRRRLLAFAHDE